MITEQERRRRSIRLRNKWARVRVMGLPPYIDSRSDNISLLGANLAELRPYLKGVTVDHYEELVLAHATRPGGARWLNSIELQIINAAHRKGELGIDGIPDGSEADGADAWVAIRRLDGGLIHWQTACVQCGGQGTVFADGVSKQIEIDCPWCGDVPPVEIITDAEGNYLRTV